MSTPAKRRLMKDLKIIKTNADKTIFAEPLEDDLMTWTAIILGPENTPFEGGTFSLVMKFSESYPQSPPKILFVSDVYHPNVYQNGELCLDILGNRWCPSYDILAVLISIQSLLNDPNVKSPANSEAAYLFEHDVKEYNIKVKECVEKSWTDIEDLKKKNDM